MLIVMPLNVKGGSWALVADGHFLTHFSGESMLSAIWQCVWILCMSCCRQAWTASFAESLRMKLNVAQSPASFPNLDLVMEGMSFHWWWQGALGESQEVFLRLWCLTSTIFLLEVWQPLEGFPLCFPFNWAYLIPHSVTWRLDMKERHSSLTNGILLHGLCLNYGCDEIWGQQMLTNPRSPSGAW